LIADIRTMMWKEWKEILLQGGSRGKWNLVVFVGVFGIFMPFQFGRDWVTSPMSLVNWAWIPLFLVTVVIADAFAGERERHTLETLLATRLSDEAILFGKICAAVSYGWGMALASMVAGLITVNIIFAGHGIVMYTPEVALSIVGISLLASILATAAGVLVSLRAATVRQAQQALSLAIMGLVFVPIFGIQAMPPETRGRIAVALGNAGPRNIMLAVVGGLILLDTLLILATRARFKRVRLVLD
jgi:ABC-2 type transport system permease protein